MTRARDQIRAERGVDRCFRSFIWNGSLVRSLRGSGAPEDVQIVAVVEEDKSLVVIGLWHDSEGWEANGSQR
jgi:hypothetical protein